MKIALVGAGPRGLLILERLIAWQRLNHTPLFIDLYDPQPIGGRVWRIDQDPNLIMNTAAQHITLFFDQSVESEGPFDQGPSLAQWAAGPGRDYLAGLDAPHIERLQEEVKTIRPNSIPSRVLFGHYLRWFYEHLLQQVGENVRVNHIKESVLGVTRQRPNFTLKTSEQSTVYQAVVIALGNLENSMTREQLELQAFADKNALRYVAPGFPAEGDLSAIMPEETVILRGLGLSFFDFVSRLTEGRGGRFEEADGTLAYRPSGKEPHIVAGSRRGLPYHAKGRNEKAPGEEWPPRFLTNQQLFDWSKQGHVKAETFWHALQHEVEYVYYSLDLPLRHPEIDKDSFQLAFQQRPDAALDEFGIPEEERFDWSGLLATPSSDHPEQAVRDYLVKDADEADKGTKTGPFTSALEVLRDMRNPIRQVVQRGLLSDDDFLDFFLRWFNGTNDFLSIGPPILRLRELVALLDAGVVEILPPHMTVTTDNGRFVAGSADRPTLKREASVLIEARVPSVSAHTAKSPLLQQLLHDDMATTFELQLAGDRRFQSGAILINRQTMQLLDAAHRPQGNLFFWGVPTEGVNWLTTASPRPFVNDVSLRAANEIVKQIIG